MPEITTHVLDVSVGRPAKGVRNVLYRTDSLGVISFIADRLTNETGRNGSPLIITSRIPRGHYKLEFYIGDYFRAQGIAADDYPFLDIVPIVSGSTTLL